MPEPRSDPIRQPWSRSDRLVPRTVVRLLQEFLRASTASGAFLVAATVVALVWANLPGDTYEGVLGTRLDVRLGPWSIEGDLRFWVNDGLMTMFFLVVGLEIKREVLTGELRGFRAAVVPGVAAAGGMLVPALLFIALAGEHGGRGWGVAMPTDIAFTLGVLALASRHVPPGLKPFLLTLAIVDDLLTIGVLAFAYGSGLSVGAIAVAAVAATAIAAAERAGVRASAAYVALGTVVWLGFHRGGLAPALAGVVVGALTPARPFQRPRSVSEEAHRTADETVDDPDPADADAPAWLRLATLSREAVSPLARVEHLLLPWTSFVILPLFALANAGISFGDGMFAEAVAHPIVPALVVARSAGKVIGIVGAAWLAVRLGIGSLPAGVRLPHLAGGAMAAAVAFTVTLFVGEIAYDPGSVELAAVKVGVLVSIVVSGVAGVLLLRAAGRSPERPEPGR